MTSEQITAMAREFAEGRYPEAKTYEGEYLRDTAAFVMEDKLRWLLQRFCLVEKSRVKDEYHEAKFACGNVDPCSETWATYQAQKSLLERLFPGLGKEVEE